MGFSAISMIFQPLGFSNAGYMKTPICLANGGWNPRGQTEFGAFAVCRFCLKSVSSQLKHQ